MTLLVTVATRTGFLMLADTRTSDSENQVICDETQKIFYSNKHKLGISIAESNFLVPYIGSVQKDSHFSLGHVITSFMARVDAMDIVKIKNGIPNATSLYGCIKRFINKAFGKQYVDAFMSQVEVIVAVHRHGNTTLARYRFDSEAGDIQINSFDFTADYNNKVCLFSNSDNILKARLSSIIDAPWFAGIPGKTKIIKQNICLSNANYAKERTFAINDLVPVIRGQILQARPDSVGKYFQFIEIDHNGVEFKDIKLQVGITSREVTVLTSGFPRYRIYKTEADFDKAYPPNNVTGTATMTI